MTTDIHNRVESAGLKGCIKKKGVFSLFSSFSDAFPLIDINTHGLTLICAQRLNTGDKLRVKLQTPQGLSINLDSEVVHLRREEGGKFEIATIRFMPFDDGISGNSCQSLKLLRDILILFDIRH